MSTPDKDIIERFCDAIWLQEGLSANTFDAYRRDLEGLSRWLLPRGTVLRDGDRLRAVNGLVIAVQAAAESVSTARSDDVTRFARVCYHLGNRHMPLQIGPGWLRYLADHVLDKMVEELGLTVVHEQAPFEPEAGAYHQHEQAGAGVFRRHHGH